MIVAIVAAVAETVAAETETVETVETALETGTGDGRSARPAACRPSAWRGPWSICGSA